MSASTAKKGSEDRKVAAEQYASMTLIRSFEERALQLRQAGDVPGALHLSLGQEAVAVGACWPLRTEDVVLSTHRGHHHCIAKGADLGRMMAEILGRKAGYARGRGGSMHMSDPDIGLLGTNGIVGGGLPIATGAAYGMTVKKNDSVVVCFFGEGAAANGVFGEAMNAAGLWKLPIILLCENNRYVEFAPAETHVSGQIFKRAEGYGFPGVRVDGTSVEEVTSVVSEAVERARSGGGPTLVEAMTYRWHGHHADDKAAYRSSELLDEWQRDHDPLKIVSAQIGEDRARDLDGEAVRQVDAAVEFALESPEASADELLLDSGVIA